jgi:hypothetical protein
VARIGGLEARWNAAALLAGRIRVERVAVDSLEVSLPAAARLQQARGAQPRRPPGALRRSWAALLPSLTVGEIEITSIRLAGATGDAWTGDLRLADLESSAGGVSAGLPRGAIASDALGLRAELSDGKLRGEPDGRIALSGLRLSSGASRVSLDASVHPALPGPPLRARVALEAVRASDLARWTAWFPELGGADSLAGVVSLVSGPGGMTGEARLRGRLAGETLEDLRLVARLGADTLRVSELEVSASAIVLAGRGSYALNGRSGRAEIEWSLRDPRSRWLPWLRGLALRSGASGRAEVAFDVPRRAAPRLEGEAEVSALGLMGFFAERIAVRGRVVPGAFAEADRLEIELGRGRVAGRGRWPLGPEAADLSVRVDSLALGEVPDEWRAELAGTVSADLRLSGPPSDLVLEGSLEAGDLRRGEWRSARVRVDSLALRLRGLRGVARARLTGLGREGDPERADLDLRVTRRAEPLGVELALRHPRLELALRGDADPGGWAELTEARLREPRLGEVELETPWRVAWTADSVRADTLRLASGRARLSFAGRWARATGELGGRVGLSGVALARVTAWLGLADTLRGTCGVQVDLAGRLPDPRITVRSECDAARWGPLDFGKLSLEAVWADSALSVGPLALEGPGHRFSVPDLRLQAGRPLLSLLRAGGAPEEPTWQGRVEVERLDLGTLEGLAEVLGLPATGALPGAQSQLLVGGAAIPLRVIAPWDPETRAPGSRLGGVLRAAIEIEGTLRAPVLRLRGDLERLELASAEVGRIAFAAHYADSLLQLERFDLEHEGQTSWARGHLPLRLSLLPPAARPGSGEARVQAELADLNLAVVSGLTRYVPDASGRLRGTLALGGTGRRPELSGTVWLRDGGFRIPGRSERIHDAQARLEIGGGALHIRALEARTGSRGTLTAVGTVRSPDDFDLNAHLENARVFEPGRYDAQVTADLNAYTVAGVNGGPSVPHLDGVAEVKMGTITQDLARKELVAAGPVIPWVIDIDVTAPGNVRVSQVNASADLGEGQLHLSYRWPLWNLSGSIKVLGGTYRLLNNAFTITDGSVEFRDTGAGPDLTVSADAETYVAAAGEAGGPSETITVQVHVQGKPEALEVSLSSQPPLSQEDIVELLSVGRLTRSGRFEAGAQTQWILMNTMVDRIENTLLQQSAIFSRVAVEPGASGEEPLKMTLRPVVTPAFLVNYSQDLAVDPSRELSVNYRLSRVLFLRAGVLRDRQAAGGFNDEYSLDLKCRFEYP